MNRPLWGILLAALAALSEDTGCAPALQNAEGGDSANSYRAFLRDHPNDDQADLAQERLAELELAKAKKLHTVAAYKRFLEEFPDSAEAPAARALLEGLRFNAAKGQGTSAALRGFLADHPDGSHRAEAERLLPELERREASGSADSAKSASLTRGRPDDLAFAQAQSAGAAKLLAYLDDFPAGSHREEVKTRLFALKLEGLLFSGLVEQAREEARRSPLAERVPELGPKIARAEEESRLAGAADPAAQAALAPYYLRPVRELISALGAPDALVRWEAAEELGQHVTVEAMDPLVRAFRSAHNPLIRQKAFESLSALLRALPTRVADYELAVRLQPLKASAASPEAHAALAALLDLSGRIQEAAAEYRKGFDPESPDPVVLWRWAALRLGQGQSFSAAVAAHQLALWAGAIAARGAPSSGGTVSLSEARALCAAVEEARFAAGVIHRAGEEKTEFPEDLAQFARQAQDAQKLSEARLQDAELALRAEQPRVALCSDRSVSDRIAASVKERAQALGALRSKRPRLSVPLLKVAAHKDPSLELRAQAAAELVELGNPR